MGLFGFGETKREKVKKIRKKESERLLKYRRVERGRVAEERELESRTKLEKKKTELSEAKTRRKEAKRESLWYLPTPKIKKKKQGKKLSRRSKIRLI